LQDEQDCVAYVSAHFCEVNVPVRTFSRDVLRRLPTVIRAQIYAVKTLRNIDKYIGIAATHLLS